MTKTLSIFLFGFFFASQAVHANNASEKQALPRGVVSFEGCPPTYPPLVANFAELELGMPLLVDGETDVEYATRVLCEGDTVSIVAHQGGWGRV